MTRKPSETVQVNLRIKESLRRRLEKAAHSHGCTLNHEMTGMLVRGLTIDEISPGYDPVQDWKARYAGEFALFTAGLELITALKQYPDLAENPQLAAAISKMQKAIDDSSVAAPFGARVTSGENK
jgi:hypothetical protein